MRITTRGRYALRATLALAKLGGGSNISVSIGTLSEKENISSIFLEQIFFRLRRAGLVASVRGPGGGFCFARPLNKLTIRDILMAAGEELDFVACDRQNEDCTRIGYCLAHAVWSDVTKLVNDYFGRITLADIIEKKRIVGIVPAAGAASSGQIAETLLEEALTGAGASPVTTKRKKGRANDTNGA